MDFAILDIFSTINKKAIPFFLDFHNILSQNQVKNQFQRPKGTKVLCETYEPTLSRISLIPQSYIHNAQPTPWVTKIERCVVVRPRILSGYEKSQQV